MKEGLNFDIMIIAAVWNCMVHAIEDKPDSSIRQLEPPSELVWLSFPAISEIPRLLIQIGR